MFSLLILYLFGEVHLSVLLQWAVVIGGLGLIPGIVGRFDSSNGLRVPHIGWNALQLQQPSVILDGVKGHRVYFVHSYRAMPLITFICLQSNANKDWVSATCNYGGEFIAAIKRGNVHAVQFHPEKSGDALCLNNDLKLDCVEIWIRGTEKYTILGSTNGDPYRMRLVRACCWFLGRCLSTGLGLVSCGVPAIIYGPLIVKGQCLATCWVHCELAK
eukprot:Gb_32907 [translate_table: standard]